MVNKAPATHGCWFMMANPPRTNFGGPPGSILGGLAATLRFPTKVNCNFLLVNQLCWGKLRMIDPNVKNVAGFQLVMGDVHQMSLKIVLDL